MGPRSYDRGNPAPMWGATRIIRASMGPRSYDRGNGNQHAPECPGLQGLQWGRDLTIAEMSRIHHRGRTERRASMGPRSYDRGNAPGWSPPPARPARASMGQRSYDRG